MITREVDKDSIRGKGPVTRQKQGGKTNPTTAWSFINPGGEDIVRTRREKGAMRGCKTKSHGGSKPLDEKGIHIWDRTEKGRNKIPSHHQWSALRLPADNLLLKEKKK